MVPIQKSTILHSSFLFLFMASFTINTSARPENIKPNLPYYADDFTIKDGISELGEEKNYEEVFKNYEYFETIYDEQKRPSIFRAYKRGEIIRAEHYFYNSSGKLIKKEITRKNEPTETIHFSSE